MDRKAGQPGVPAKSSPPGVTDPNETSPQRQQGNHPTLAGAGGPRGSHACRQLPRGGAAAGPPGLTPTTRAFGRAVSNTTGCVAPQRVALPARSVTSRRTKNAGPASRGADQTKVPSFFSPRAIG